MEAALQQRQGVHVRRQVMCLPRYAAGELGVQHRAQPHHPG